MGLRFAARLIDLVVVVVPMIVVFSLVPDDRPLASFVAAFAVPFAYEALLVSTTGATVGKAAVGLRVVPLDRSGHPTLAVAARRALTDVALAALLVIGWAAWIFSIQIDPLRRGTADRVARTMVVPKAATVPVRSQDLAGYADAVKPPRLTPFGRVGDTDVRMRARLFRVVGTPAMAALAGLLAFLPVVFDGWQVFIAAIGVWLVAFVVDETIRIHRHGATSGHTFAGLTVVDHRTGGRPGTGRAVARALVLGLLVYVPVLWPLLLISLIVMAQSSKGRGLHDLAGGTIVIGDPRLDPEAQRQRAMSLRTGRAG